jgi:hypothetical protein
MSTFNDTISTEKRGSDYLLEHFGDNYFILYGMEKNYKFNASDFNRGLLQRARVELSEEEKKNIIFTFSESKFIRLD